MKREPAVLLALLRIAVALVVLVSPEPALANVVVHRSRALWTLPEGLGWLPLDAHVLAVMTAVLRASAVMTLLGAVGRVASAVLAVSILYVFGAAQLTGTVLHDMHLFWFAALLSVTPSNRALSLDAWAAGAPQSAGDVTSWGIPVARLWLAAVYFFPGLHKLLDGGLAWITSDNLRNQMWFKWYENDVVPWPRVDRVAHLPNVGAALVVSFELAMPFLVAARRTRLVACACALLFHLASGHFMFVLFPSLIVCLVVLFPGDVVRAFVDRVSRAERRMRDVSAIPLVVLAAPFTLAIVIQGVRGQMQAYPFACYPTFATLAPDEIADLAVDVTEDGATRTVRLPRHRRQDEWGMVWRTAGLYGDRDPERLRAFARMLVPGVREATVFLETYAVQPEARNDPPRRRIPLSALP